MNRRDFLGSAGVAATALSGCLESLGFQTESAWRDPPLPENRPEAVYVPAVAEGMDVYGTIQSSDLEFALMHSFPHRFWNLTATNRSKVVVRSEDSLHLMASVWDTETDTILPLDVSLTVREEGQQVAETTMWPMLSQTMGFHYGDNVALPGDGTYEATFRVGPLQRHTTPPLAERFTTAQTATLTFEFVASDTYDLTYRRVGDRAGTTGSLSLMEMSAVPDSRAPPTDELPGRLVGTRTSGDAEFPAVVVGGDTRFSDSGQPHLLVSPRTPYNRIVLPRMSLSARIERDSETLFDGSLRPSVDPTLGVYYDAPVDDIVSEDMIHLFFDAPPQLARHDGYETSFLDFSPVSYTV